MSFCGFAPTHIPLDLTKSAHKHSYKYKYIYMYTLGFQCGAESLQFIQPSAGYIKK